tara:strand:+ start:338 stop:724 length:387 start_codon:yes stop_codon:yes gene_type:complete
MTVPFARGQHIMLDYINFHPRVADVGDWMLQSMLAACEDVGVRIVHSHVEKFDGTESPEGFASVVLIDESHVSAHCYSEEGLLALDAFTCGGHNPSQIVAHIDATIRAICPEVEQISRHEVDRFLHRK